MNKINKVLIFGLIAVFCLMFAGCSQKTDVENESSNVSLTVSGENEKTEDEGIELPDQVFDTDKESNDTQNTNTNKEDDGKTSSSGESVSQNTSSEVSVTTSSTQDAVTSSENESKDSNTSSAVSSTTSSEPNDATSSENESEEDNTSSDDVVSEPSQSEDGSIELPMDKW